MVKLRQLVGAERVLAELVPKKVRDGRVAYRLYRVLKQYEEELQKFREVQQELLGEWVGKTISEEVIAQTPELQEIVQKLEQILEEPIGEPLYKFRADDFEGMEMSVQQVAALVELGVLEEG